MCFSLPGPISAYWSFVTNVSLLHYDYRYNAAALFFFNKKINTSLTRRFWNVTKNNSKGKSISFSIHKPDPKFTGITGKFVRVASRCFGSAPCSWWRTEVGLMQGFWHTARGPTNSGTLVSLSGCRGSWCQDHLGMCRKLQQSSYTAVEPKLRIQTQLKVPIKSTLAKRSLLNVLPNVKSGALLHQ